MKIIKSIKGHARIIAGEILNIEQSKLLFVDGILVKDQNTVADDYNSVTDENEVQYKIHCNSGYILIPQGVSWTKFVKSIIKEIQILEKLITPCAQYKTRSTWALTSIKIVNDARETVIEGPNDPSIKRVFTQKVDKCVAQWTWIVAFINSVSFQIDNENVAKSIALHVSSIFFDSENICKLPHGSRTLDFSEKNLVGYDYLIPVHLKLSSHVHPLLIELNSRRDKITRRLTFKNVPREILYEKKFDQLNISPTEKGDGTLSTQICNSCKSDLWDDNYVVSPCVDNEPIGTLLAMCPICAHSPDTDYEYDIMFRVKFPMTAAEAIMTEKNEIKKDVFKGILRGLLHGTRGNVNFIAIGEKYIAFSSVKDFLYSNMALDPFFHGKKICSYEYMS